ncbi:LCP family protein [Actinocrinis puniceicyclus]|uniref:LCP family protein n=1 Tax=Actinocrinis puniceicyclus TaxID=977794 RepID=A0A8J7WQE5_9ACTN|nr:LCP family protein [Actinocrinis puniceicyclus]MBS2964467.1 LCP family protein [Actinocrinis puniceicyclus]
MAALGRRRLRELRVAVVVASTLAVGISGALGYVYLHLNANIKTFSEVGVSRSRPPEATPATTAPGQPAAQPPINLLLIGSDTRAGGNVSLGGGFAVEGARSDTTILLHVSGDRKHAVGVSIPRDALVDVPACYANGGWLPAQTDVMFNSAFSEGNLPTGNPICTQNTVEAMSGIRIDHTMVIDFSGFAAMSRAVGGVTVCVPAVNSTYLEHAYGVTLDPGVQNLSGQAAVEYVRAREGFGDNSDIGRMKRQQAFLSALMKKMLDSGTLDNPVALYQLADAATKSLTVDSSLDSVSSLVSLGVQLKTVPLYNLEFVTTPWSYDGARVDLIQPDTDVLWSLLREDRTLEGQDASGGASATSGPTGSASAAPTASPGPSAASERMRLMALGEAGPSSSASTGTSPSAVASDEASAAGTTAGTPTPVPSGITQNIRRADSDPCSDLSYGN